MSANYGTFGPFELKRQGPKLAENAFRDFWRLVEAEQSGLCDAVGVYLLTVRAKRTSAGKPWYVGRTDRLGFQKRLAQQELRFREVLEAAKNGRLEILLVALKTPGRDAFRKPTVSKISSNDWLESMMIGSALARNRKLINASKLKHFKTVIVPGFINNKQGKLSSSASALKKSLGVQQ